MQCLSVLDCFSVPSFVSRCSAFSTDGLLKVRVECAADGLADSSSLTMIGKAGLS